LPRKTFVTVEAALEAATPKGGKLAGVWTYPGDVMRVGRFNLPDGSKQFRPVHRVENGWQIGDPPGPLPLYRVDEIPPQGSICVTEGERCADLAHELGLPAVTSAHGALSPAKSDWTRLAGRDVVILPDNDTAGEKYAATVMEILIGLKCRVKIVKLPGLPVGGDIVDFDGEIAGSAGATRAEIEHLADTVSWTDSTDAGPDLTPTALSNLWKTDAELREPVIDGLLRRGQVGNLVSTSKAYKTFLVLLLAICMAMKRAWLDVFPTVGGRVLMIDLELQKPDITQRTRELVKALHAPPEIADQIDVLSFRGRNGNIDQIETMLLTMKPGTYSLVILDPLYKSYPPDFDENSNAQMTVLYRRFERIAEHLDCAMVIVHHATKGSQSEKRVVDVGAGAGSQSRSADWHGVLREHAEDGCVVFDMRVRSFRPPAPVVMRFKYPVWERDTSLDPTRLKSGKPSRVADKPAPKETPEPWTAERFAKTYFTSEPQEKRLIVARARQNGIKNREVDDLLALALAEKSIFRWVYPKNKTVFFANIEQPVILSGGKS
jgi:hypothetical protein